MRFEIKENSQIKAIREHREIGRIEGVEKLAFSLKLYLLKINSYT